MITAVWRGGKGDRLALGGGGLVRTGITVAVVGHGDAVSVRRPFRPIGFVPRVLGRNRLHGITAEICAGVPASKGVAFTRHIRWQSRPHAIGVAGDDSAVDGAAIGVKGHRELLRRLLLPMSVDGGVIRKDCVGRYFISTSFFRVPAKEVIAAACRSGQAFQLPVFGAGAGRVHAAAVGVKGHGVLLSCLLLPMSVDGGVICKDRVVRYFLSTVFLCVPAKEVIAAACRSRQAFQLPVFGGGAGRAYAAAVGVKGHGVLLSCLLLPMSIDDRVLRKDCVGRYFLSTSFFRVPAKEVIAAACRGRQAFQLPVFGLGAGWAYAAAVCVKGYCIFLNSRSVYHLNGNVRFHGVVVGCVIRCEDCRIGLCSFGLRNGVFVFPFPAFRQCHVGKRFSHLCGNAGRHCIGRICFCNRQVKGTLGVIFFSNRA